MISNLATALVKNLFSDSVIDTKLAKYGFNLELNPYRIIDLKTKKTVVLNRYLDLTDNVLDSLRRSFDRLEAQKFKKVS